MTHRSALEQLAKLLMEKEVVDRPALQAILKVKSIDSLKEKNARWMHPRLTTSRSTLRMISEAAAANCLFRAGLS